jgi:hypothetical protein
MSEPPAHANRLLWDVLHMRFSGRVPGWQIGRMERIGWRSPRLHEPRAWTNRRHPMARFWRKGAGGGR